MIQLARSTFLSILRTRIFWVMLGFSVVLISVIGYFSTRAFITGAAFIQEGIDEPMDEEEAADFILGRKGPSRKEVADLNMEFDDWGCGPAGPTFQDAFSTPLVAGMQYFGFIFIAFLSNIAAVFLMMGLLPRELERRSIYTLIAKPLSRTDIYLGKLFGGWASIFLFNFVLGFMYMLFMYFAGAPLSLKFLMVAVVSSLSPMMFGMLALVLGTFLRTTAVGFFTVVLLFFGSDIGNLFIYGIGVELLGWETITNFILTYLPPLPKIMVLVGAYIEYTLFEGLSEMFHEMDALKVYSKWWLNALWVGGYFIGMIFIGWVIFRRKEFN